MQYGVLAFPCIQIRKDKRYINIPRKNQGVYFLLVVGIFTENNAGTQNKIIHQYLSILEKISKGVMPKIAATMNPTNPDIHLNRGDQNLNNNSEMTHKPIESPNKSRFIPKLEPQNHLLIA